jgi:NAD(P)H-dependent flavin oxidoreductase YrpB (nitropropane dioxygenase family)
MKTKICNQLGIDIPIFGFSHCRDVVVEVSKAGGMGILGAAKFTPEQLEIELAWIDKHIEGKPYGLDLLLPGGGKDEPDEYPALHDLEAQIPDPHLQFVENLLREYQVPEFSAEAAAAADAARVELCVKGYDPLALFDVAVRHNIALFVSALGTPPKQIFSACRAKGIKVAAMAGSAKHAISHRDGGVDIIIAQGGEAGGHTGDISTMVLVPDIVDAVKPLPVLAAGGIGCGRQVAASIALGAEGAWLGSLWLATEESDLNPVLKEKLVAAQSGDTARSKCLSGKPVRQLYTPWLQAWDGKQSPGYLPRPLMHLTVVKALERIEHFAQRKKSGAGQLISSPVGQVVGRLNSQTTVRQQMYELVSEYLDSCGRIEAINQRAGE